MFTLLDYHNMITWIIVTCIQCCGTLTWNMCSFIMFEDSSFTILHPPITRLGCLGWRESLKEQTTNTFWVCECPILPVWYWWSFCEVPCLMVFSIQPTDFSVVSHWYAEATWVTFCVKVSCDEWTYVWLIWLVLSGKCVYVLWANDMTFEYISILELVAFWFYVVRIFSHCLTTIKWSHDFSSHDFDVVES